MNINAFIKFVKKTTIIPTFVTIKEVSNVRIKTEI